MRKWFATHGLPEQLVSDNGPQFRSADFAEFMKGNGVKHIRCAPYHPSSNGAAERFVRTVKEALKSTKGSGRTLQQRLQNFLLSYRTIPHATTGVAPCTLFLGRSLRTRLELLRPDLQQRVCEKQAKQKSHHDQHAKTRHFEIGQLVMVRNLRPGPTWIPATIAEQRGPLSYLVTVENGEQWRRHVDHLKPREDSTFPRNEERLDRDSIIPFESSVEEAEVSSTTDTSANQSTSPAVPSSSPRYPHQDRRPPDRFGFSVDRT